MGPEHKDTVANLYRIGLRPAREYLFRGLRPAPDAPKPGNSVTRGKFLYRLEESTDTPEKVAATFGLLKDFVDLGLRAALSQCDLFFDLSPFSLQVTIEKEFLHREKVFSILRSIQMQVVAHVDGLYLAVLPGRRLYNRMPLAEVLRLLGEHALHFPLRILCYAGDPGEEKWQDAQLLSVDHKACLVRVPSLRVQEITVPSERVIPRLGKIHIKSLLRLLHSSTNLDKILQEVTYKDRPNELNQQFLRDHVRPLFPLRISTTEVELSDHLSDLAELGGDLLTHDSQLKASSDQGEVISPSILDGLRRMEYRNARERPVVLLTTPERRDGLETLVRVLNSPEVSFAGYRGLPVHFGIRLKPSPQLLLSKDVEGYVALAESLVLSPDPEKSDALVLVALSEEDESYLKPIPLYYRLKAIFSRTGHASQMVDEATLTNKYARWNLALNIAAKLGSVPWSLAHSDELEPVDLFLGLSFSQIRTEQLGVSRTVAYVNVFDRSGGWRLLWSDGATFNFAQRVEVFPRVARDAVLSATDEPASLRLVEVHYNKRFGRAERMAIAQGVKSVSPEASVLFVSINDEHPVRFSSRKLPHGAAERGTYVEVGDGGAFLQTVTGDRLCPSPRPLRLIVFPDHCRVKPECQEVARRVLALTRLNWKSIREYSTLPVTILYSSAVARLTNYFGHTDWGGIDHQLKRRAWFL